jgi:Na+-transporting NADH:ubiquinone oxidoreductase subunit NqrD
MIYFHYLMYFKSMFMFNLDIFIWLTICWPHCLLILNHCSLWVHGHSIFYYFKELTSNLVLRVLSVIKSILQNYKGDDSTIITNWKMITSLILLLHVNLLLGFHWWDFYELASHIHFFIFYIKNNCIIIKLLIHNHEC